MKIGEIAKAAGVSTSRIRFYEREGIIPAADRSANGYRDYPAELVTLLRFIEQAQGLGFTLREISGVGIGTGEHIVSCADALELLAGKRDSITALIAEAQDRKQRIEALMAELEASRAARRATG
ncbi:MerR family transcriptional regulator [Paracoccus sp. S1E-3]|uniref:MerR family transcriptional regulator n=1 Tax=Paracoccus sp. S1E-3 TaxID=2756130 RepID=UPI0015EE7965|nr:MerR family transcriptional regulator [Paracoccus sp. S1E-3]MBA4491761.1 MerR family DNA-binding transcriptional regulator [Paracoccus sp. S1E-3]